MQELLTWLHMSIVAGQCWVHKAPSRKLGSKNNWDFLQLQHKKNVKQESRFQVVPLKNFFWHVVYISHSTCSCCCYSGGRGGVGLIFCLCCWERGISILIAAACVHHAEFSHLVWSILSNWAGGGIRNWNARASPWNATWVKSFAIRFCR